MQFNKILKGIAEVMFRSCKFTKPGSLEPESIRSKVFLSAPNGVFDTSQKSEILSKIAKEEGCSEDDILESLYSDLEDEEILSEIPEISEDELCRRFNLEQVETLLMRAVSLSISFLFLPIFSVKRSFTFLAYSMPDSPRKVGMTVPAFVLRLTDRSSVWNALAPPPACVVFPCS